MATAPATIGDTNATESLHVRSARLREALAVELQRDVEAVARHEPEALTDAADRQAIVRDIASTAKLVHAWGDERPQPAIRIAVMSQAYISSKDADAPELPASSVEEAVEPSEAD